MKTHILFSAMVLSGVFLVGGNAVLAESSNGDQVNSEKTHPHDNLNHKNDQEKKNQQDNESNANKEKGVENVEKNKKEQKHMYDSDQSAPKYDPSVEPGIIKEKDMGAPGKSSPSSKMP